MLVVKNQPPSAGDRRDRVQSLGREGIGRRRKWQPTPTHPSILAGVSHGQRSLAGLQFMGSQRVQHDWASKHSTALIRPWTHFSLISSGCILYPLWSWSTPSHCTKNSISVTFSQPISRPSVLCDMYSFEDFQTLYQPSFCPLHALLSRSFLKGSALNWIQVLLY